MPDNHNYTTKRLIHQRGDITTVATLSGPQPGRLVSPVGANGITETWTVLVGNDKIEVEFRKEQDHEH